MRDILFKAKRKNWRELSKEKQWVYGSLITGERLFPKRKEYFITEISNRGNCTYEVDGETVCQYTGLKDKDGNRIWENDIVEAWSEGQKAIGKVKRRIDGLYIMYPAYQKKFWGLLPDDLGETTVNIIGNIFDNPELLERSQHATDKKTR